MTLRVLDDDALLTGPEGSELRIALPWIRSMALSCVHDLTVEVDGERVEVLVLLGDRRLPPAALLDEAAWWYLQDRLMLELPAQASGPHTVAVSYDLEVPYLALGPTPLRLPIRDTRELGDVSRTARPARQDVA